MTRARTAIILTLVLVAVTVGVLAYAVPRWYAAPSAVVTAPVVPSEAPASEVRKINARLFYVAEDGWHLTGTDTEVPLAQDTVGQAREIVLAQLAAAAPPLVSAIPEGTALRAIYLTPEGEAYVDLSQDLAIKHPGGSMNEMLTVYTIVHALTLNLPAVKSVQVLVDGREIETLAGHLDLRRPLEKRLSLVVE